MVVEAAIEVGVGEVVGGVVGEGGGAHEEVRVENWDVIGAVWHWD